MIMVLVEKEERKVWTRLELGLTFALRKDFSVGWW